MYSLAEKNLAALLQAGGGSLLQDSLIGLEKESLRVSAQGCLAQTPHPRSLGSALTHPYITTDYSEALLELITPPFRELSDALVFLRSAHQFVYHNLGDEYLWSTSMPCVLDGEKSIPLAYYGESNPGRMKTIYRRGLGHRYGRVMQVIAGVHLNYSFAEAFWPALQDIEKNRAPLQSFINNAYFRLLRNLQRFGWLVPYLFGASPAVCKSFLKDYHTTSLVPFEEHTYYEPYATSMRMGDIGYQNNQEHETGIEVPYDNLENYIQALERAIRTPCPNYRKIGVKVGDEYRQLNDHILQIENEYYSTVRPKQPPQGNERPALALRRRGVRYIELRSLDVNAYDPLGINEAQLRFLEAFIVFCLFQESPPISAEESREINYNQSAAAHRGRDPSLLLRRQGRTQLLRTWASELCTAMQGVCEILDQGLDDTPYQDALSTQAEAVHNTDCTPSARMLEEMRSNRESFFQFAERLSLQHQSHFRQSAENAQQQGLFAKEAQDSLARQTSLEQKERNSGQSFSHYLASYFA